MCLVPHTITKKINFIALIEFNLADPGQTGSLRAEKEIYKEKGQIKAYITIKKKADSNSVRKKSSSKLA
jgi:hypothetical protein